MSSRPKQSATVARPAGRYFKGKAPKGADAVGSDSDDSDEEGQQQQGQEEEDGGVDLMMASAHSGRAAGGVGSGARGKGGGAGVKMGKMGAVDEQGRIVGGRKEGKFRSLCCRTWLGEG
jgi:microfibrillar-associated protein 1